MVEDERISGGINGNNYSYNNNSNNNGGSSNSMRGASGETWPTPPQSPGMYNYEQQQQRGGAAASSGHKLYTDYLRSQGDGRGRSQQARYVGGRSRPPSSQADGGGGSLDGEDAFRMNTTKPLDFEGLG